MLIYVEGLVTDIPSFQRQNGTTAHSIQLGMALRVDVPAGYPLPVKWSKVRLPVTVADSKYGLRFTALTEEDAKGLAAATGGVVVPLQNGR
jgi:hypothetical protein